MGIPAENIEQLIARLKVIESALSVLENEQTRAKTANGQDRVGSTNATAGGYGQGGECDERDGVIEEYGWCPPESSRVRSPLSRPVSSAAVATKTPVLAALDERLGLGNTSKKGHKGLALP
ncbi:hypothetical protein BDP27DRAFT_1371245 [Rhodocollybia butyracea]|uniref:Uncharacterized protein n=1 Tax=Rhodocollybia butyracea TaxID=206335 RepID=A0A9P5PCL7_9AGAR|nr:hypothetical protein BDP27DRAFT_1371245 [Rhodocollybia butyracea]